LSGDGGDAIISDIGGYAIPAPANAVIVTNTSNPGQTWPVACAGKWISDNANGFTLPAVPATMVFQRSFSISPALISNGSFGITFGGDDEIAFVLTNSLFPSGVTIASCLSGGCQTCRGQVFNGNLLNGSGPNTLTGYLINTLSIPTGVGSNYGYTGLYYELCVSGNTPTVTPTPCIQSFCIDSGDGNDPGLVVVTSPYSGWGTPCGSSQWISTNASGNDPLAGLVDTRTINIPAGANLSLSTFTLKVMADDDVAVTVNGTSSAGCTYLECYASCKTIVMPSSLFVIGTNTISFTAPNGDGGPGGLDFELCANLSYCGPTPTPTPSPTVTPVCHNYSDNFSNQRTLSNYDFFNAGTQGAGTAASTGYAISGGSFENTGGTSAGGLAVVDNAFFSHAINNYTIDVDVNMENYNNQGLIGIAFRTGNNGSFYCFQLNGLLGWQLESNTGSPVVTFTYPGPSTTTPAFLLNTWIHMQVVVVGNNFKCYVNLNQGAGNQLIFNVTDNTYTS
jgi:hypothetical protein